MTIRKDDILAVASEMSVMDLNELTKAFEEKFGASATGGSALSSGSTDISDKLEFDVYLTSVGANNIATIKAVREITGLGLKEAKDLVASAPKKIKEATSIFDAAIVKRKLAEAGAKAEIK